MRKRRQYSATGLYHVVIRGVNKQNIFFDDEDRNFFISLLKRYSLKFNIKIHAYCLMDNHVHLQFEDENRNISIFMQALCSLYARTFNRKYDRIGHLFQERYASEIILDKSYFLTVFRYIIQNPKRAGIALASEYCWSSISQYKKSQSFVEKGLLLEYLGSPEKLLEYIESDCKSECLEIELRPSEREKSYIDKVKEILETDNPIVPPDISMNLIKCKMRKLREAGLSIRTISRITGISKYVIQCS